ncbi:MAG: phenylalanine--tRNA ligase subunit beta [Canibacter sp.]
MRIPLSWLGDLVTLRDNATPESVHADLVSVGFEEEDLHVFESTGPIVVGEVLTREPEEHSNGKTVNWCQVRVAPEGEQAADGGEDVRGIVCGAHNFDVGDKVVVTLPGAVLPGDFQIAARKTYGHVSDGMIASQRELGLGDEHDGIIVLADLGLDAPVGTAALELLGMQDAAVEINVTPDRGYAFSVRGVAREYSHATGSEFVDPATELTQRAFAANVSGFDVVLNDTAPIRGREGAAGFIVRTVRGVDQSRPTPQWMVARLILAGQRPLGLAADISNYVMLELGNPLHAYDAAKVSGGITVRRAAPGETLVTLDGQERKLDAQDLVITDDSGVIGLAGVMGGESTKTDESTTDVLIEAATFDPISIARTSRRHKLPSEASKRFERGVDPLVARAAAQRMVDLLVEYGGGTADSLGSDLAAEWTAQAVFLPQGFVNSLVGVEYTPHEIREALELIGCHVVERNGDLEVTAPSWRSDLTRKHDLAEEVARIHGYDRIPSVLPTAPAGRGFTREQKLRRRAANHITAVGFTEVQNYPFVSQSQLDRFDRERGMAENTSVRAIKLVNPLDGSAPFLRRSLLPGLIACAQRNYSRGLVDLSLVEFGSVFLPEEGKVLGTQELPPLAELPSDETLAALNDSIPEQNVHVGGVFVGQRIQSQPFQPSNVADWADAIEAARQVAWSVGAELAVSQGSHSAFHPGRTAVLQLNGEPVGRAGELLPQLVADLHLPVGASAFEIDLTKLIALAPKMATVKPLVTYPAATQDVTLIVDASIPAADVLRTFEEGAGELLEHARLVADYQGDGIEDGKRALTFALRFRAADRTLKAEDASEAKFAGVQHAETVYGAKIRD